jgi:hypothetical protein
VQFFAMAQRRRAEAEVDHRRLQGQRVAQRRAARRRSRRPVRVEDLQRQQLDGAIARHEAQRSSRRPRCRGRVVIAGIASDLAPPAEARAAAPRAAAHARDGCRRCHCRRRRRAGAARHPSTTKMRPTISPVEFDRLQALQLASNTSKSLPAVPM